MCERETVDSGRGWRLPQQTGLRLVCQSVSQSARVPAEILVLGDRVTTRFLTEKKGGQDRAVQDERSWRTSFKNYFHFDHRLH